MDPNSSGRAGDALHAGPPPPPPLRMLPDVGPPGSAGPPLAYSQGPPAMLLHSEQMPSSAVAAYLSQASVHALPPGALPAGVSVPDLDAGTPLPLPLGYAWQQDHAGNAVLVGRDMMPPPLPLPYGLAAVEAPGQLLAQLPPPQHMLMQPGYGQPVVLTASGGGGGSGGGGSSGSSGLIGGHAPMQVLHSIPGPGLQMHGMVSEPMLHGRRLMPPGGMYPEMHARPLDPSMVDRSMHSMSQPSATASRSDGSGSGERTQLHLPPRRPPQAGSGGGSAGYTAVRGFAELDSLFDGSSNSSGSQAWGTSAGLSAAAVSLPPLCISSLGGGSSSGGAARVLDERRGRKDLAHECMHVGVHAHTPATHSANRSDRAERGQSGSMGSPKREGNAEQASVTRLKALLSQCPPTEEVFRAILSHTEPASPGSEPLTLPAITKLLSKLNKRGQWRHGLALFWALPALGVLADAPMANAALGACDRGKDGDSAWQIYSLMLSRELLMDSISFKALLSALAKVDHWRRCCAVFVHAVKDAVPLEAVSVMVLLFALVRAQRWYVAELVFLCTYECTCDTSMLRAAAGLPDVPAGPVMAVQPAVPGNACASAGSATASVGSMSQYASSGTERNMSTGTAGTASSSTNANSSKCASGDSSATNVMSPMAPAVAKPAPASAPGATTAGNAAADVIALAPCPSEEELLCMLRELHAQICEAKRLLAGASGERRGLANVYAGPGSDADARAANPDLAHAGLPRPKVSAQDAAQRAAKRALPRCRSVTSQLTVNRIAKGASRSAEMLNASAPSSRRESSDALLVPQPSSEHAEQVASLAMQARPGVPQRAPQRHAADACPPPASAPAPLALRHADDGGGGSTQQGAQQGHSLQLAPGRRPSPGSQQQLPFPSIPEEPGVMMENAYVGAAATNISNSMSVDLDSSGSATAAAWLPRPHGGPARVQVVSSEVLEQLQQLWQRRMSAAGGQAGATAAQPPAARPPRPVAPAAAAVSLDVLEVLEGMGDDPVSRCCANALLRAYARGRLAETLPRAELLIGIMQQAGGHLAPDVTSFNTVISMHCGVGNIAHACDVLRQLLSAGSHPTIATYRPMLLAASMREDGGPFALQLWQHLRRSGLSPDPECVQGFIGAVMHMTDLGLTAAALDDGMPFLDGSAPAAPAAAPSGAWSPRHG
eukprot:jgi/Ulvmu1/3926/UM018_0149.1